MKRFIFLMLILLVAIVACAKYSDDKEHLPTGATNIIDKGNGWSQYTLDGNVYLYHKTATGYYGFECITKIR